MLGLLEISGQVKEPTGIAMHIQLSGLDTFQALRGVVPVEEFQISKPIFAAFFPHVEVGEEEWDRLQEEMEGNESFSPRLSR